jgi:GTPase SAR1 family protein
MQLLHVQIHHIEKVMRHKNKFQMENLGVPHLKVILVGNSCVGKICLMVRQVNKSFEDRTVPTTAS